MIILYGDYLDLNHHFPYEWGKPDNVSQKEADELRPYWELFEQGKLNLVTGVKRAPKWSGRPNEWEENVWLDICHSWFGENGYTTYTIVKPSTRPGEDQWQRRTGKWIDRAHGIVVTEWFDSRIPNPPVAFEDYIEKMREYTQKEFKRITAHDFEDELTNSLIKTSEYDRVQRWLNKTESRWFHEWKGVAV